MVSVMATSNDVRIPKNRYFTLREVSGKGFYGLFAKRGIKAGTLIFIEPALFPHPPAKETTSAAELRILAALVWCVLTPAKKKAYMQLARSPDYVVTELMDGADSSSVRNEESVLRQYFHSLLLGIDRANGISWQGVYEVASRFNHSCLPNCEINTKMKQRHVTVYVVADVKRDEELTISYLKDLYEPREARRDSLLSSKYFTCSCRFCTSPENLQLEIDRARIKRLTSDLSFLMYRIESAENRRIRDLFDDSSTGRVKGRRALGPLSPSVVNAQGQIQLDAAMTELDFLLSRSGVHGRAIAFIYTIIWEVALNFAGTRSQARAGRAFEYADRWVQLCCDGSERSGALDDPRGRKVVAMMKEQIERLRPQLDLNRTT